MAVIFPEQFPKICLENLRGEAKVFDALKNQLGSDWNVYYSVYWHGKSSFDSKQRDGETDFIVTHPKYGILVIEVKGGVFIQYDAKNNSWTSTDLGLEANPIHDPFVQARKNKYSLIDNLLRLPQYRDCDKHSLINSLNIGCCVVFSEVTRVSGTMPLDAPKETTLFEYDLNNLQKKIIQVMTFLKGDSVIDDSLLKQAHYDIKNILAPLLTMDRSMPYWINEEEKRIIELTEDQYNILENLQLMKQASIYGCAGSGKTLLAIKKAQKSAQQNQRTLLCCYNLILGKKFRSYNEGNENLLADNFHNVMKELFLPFEGTNFEYDKDEEIMEKVFTYDIPKFDCILIDEAQDFSKNQLDILRYLLKKDGILYYFWDSNQKIIRNDVNIPDDVPKFTLNTNLRNTVKIFDQIKQHYHEGLELRHKGPEGRNVKVCSPYKADQPHDLYLKLRTELNDLLKNHGLKPSDVTILSFKAKTKSVLMDFKYGDTKIDFFEDVASPNSIRIDTVRRFKGMESPIVIVTEMDDEKSLNDPNLWEDMCYVSYSRAKNHLVILPPDNVTL